MVLSSIAGAIGFLTRIPVGAEERSFEAFARTPVAFPLVGYLIGALLAAVLLIPVQPATRAVLFVAGVYAVTGITHVDGLIDLGDAAAVHGDRERRQAVMTDTTVGSGGVLAVAVVVLGLGTAAFGLASAPRAAALLAISAEVGAKAAMALVVAVGTPSHDGLGATFLEPTRPRSAWGPLLAAIPAALIGWPTFVPSVASVLAAIGAGGIVWAWARHTLGGVSGDVLGATNEIARVVALHVGVIAWMHW